MSKHPFLQIDAFTNARLGGNPCAVLFDADSIDEKTMLAIAKEQNLSETAFIIDSEKADFGARYFTPSKEIPLAGHPTIATAHALLERGAIRLSQSSTTFTLELRAGIISVEVERQRDLPPKIVMSQCPPQFLNTYEPEAVCPAFGISTEDLISGVPIQTVSTGTPQLMIPLKSLECLQKVRVNYSHYRTLVNSGDFFSPHLFCCQGISSEGSTFARHFGLPPDTTEDAFTGSATGGMAAYLWRYGLLKTSKFTAEQGHWMGRPGKAYVEVIGSREKIEIVKVGGSAVTIIRGEFEI